MAWVYSLCAVQFVKVIVRYGLAAGDGVLFEFTEAQQWAERGRGEMRVKVANKSGQVGGTLWKP